MRDNRTGIYPAWLQMAWSVSAIVFICLLQPAVGWRDGPEFVDSAWVLGIAHPAGFPLYQSLVWMFEQIPLADIALRNHLFSTLFTILAAIVLYHTVLSFVRLITSHKEEYRDRMYVYVAGWISLCWLAMTPQVENAIQSEVYSLHAFFTFLVSKLLFDFLYSRERKYYVLATFLAGFGAGNHITLGVMIFALIIVLGVYHRFRDAAGTACAGMLAGAWGLCVYIFLPVRSFRNPSFDWGDPENLQRFWNHISDKKDAGSHFSAAYDLIEGFVQPFIKQMLTLHEWFGFLGLFMLASGWLLLIYRYPRPALSCLIWLLVLFLFFINWTSGTVLTGTLGILLLGFLPFAIMLAEAVRHQDKRKKYTALLCAAVVGGCIFLNIYHASIGFLGHRADYLPKESVESELLALPYRATVMSALPWFHVRGLADIEGMRPDVSIIGLGDVISPHYFKALEPGQVPLLAFPETTLPKTGKPDDQIVTRFLGEIVNLNRDKSRFYVTLEEAFLDTFIDHVAASSGMWAEVSPYGTQKNDCADMRNAIYSSLGYMLEENGAVEDPEAVFALKFPYYAWLYMTLRREPHCTQLATGMLRWWMRWLAQSKKVPENAIYNDLGVIYAMQTYKRGARIMFQIAYDAGSLEGGLNLGGWYDAHGKHEKAAAIYKRLFIASGEAKALRKYREAVRKASKAD